MTLTLTRKPENRTHTLLIVAMWAALIVSVALLFSKCFFGVTETQDEGYQALNKAVTTAYENEISQTEDSDIEVIDDDIEDIEQSM